MEKFDAVLMKHGETFIQHVLDTWERYQGIHHFYPMMLEDRWERFIRATDPVMPSIAA